MMRWKEVLKMTKTARNVAVGAGGERRKPADSGQG